MLQFEPTTAAKGALVAANPLMDLLVLDEMRLLPERLRAHVAAEGLLAGVCAEVHLNIGLVEEAPIAYPAAVHRLLLAQ